MALPICGIRRGQMYVVSIKTITMFYYVICIFMFFSIMGSLSAESTASFPAQKLIIGFTATPNPKPTTFQPILFDSSRNFSLGFLRVNQDQLALAIVHVPSGESFWQPNSVGLAQWGKHTQLFFNGSLVFTDPKSGVFWSSNNSDGDHVVLTSATNLQILNGNSNSIVWQSFDFPSDTLVENQNFTSAMSLISSNGLYTMRLGFDFIGLYAKFKPDGSGSDQIYFKHGALQAKAQIVPGHGPIVVRISSDGFMGMYQNSSVPADVNSFNSYQRTVPGPRRVRIESDGNLKGYYWSGSSWNLDYVAIPEPCELPSPCGPYGLCTPGAGCSCLDNQTQTQAQAQTKSHKCPGSRYESEPGDLCSKVNNKYRELRRTGVELPYKELMMYTKTESYESCQKSCVENCSCWGALYNNASGFCYYVDYPIQSILGVGDEAKLGYFKVWEGVEKKRERWVGIGVGLLCGSIFILLGVLSLACFKLCKRNSRKNDGFLEHEDIACSTPYKDLGSSSFGSIELSNNK
ncbi:PAN domain-containing protein At5g03700 [Silene latifolia]|uniref:PAN domain-containing protein At5g03700 n=1 Tax=Silene latifolia TaxID=37657 RepID=UPI003D77F914